MEDLLLKTGFIFYSLYLTAGIISLFYRREGKLFKYSPAFLSLSLVPHGMAILVRWVRLGHGPYIGLFEGLLSGLWLSVLFYTCVIFVKQEMKKTSVTGGVIVWIWYAWIMVADRGDTVLPAVYETWWFAVHVVSGKISYGIFFPIFIISLYQLFQSLVPTPQSSIPSPKLPMQSINNEKLAYRYMGMVFAFATAMMVSGAIWAQKAWGREWSWESLEVWSLFVWLSYGLYLHLRITYNKSFKKIWHFYVIVSYLLTFYNLFGIPFFSDVIHKGVL